MKTQVLYSDEHIAAIWLCDLLVTERKKFLGNVNSYVNELSPDIKDAILRETGYFSKMKDINIIMFFNSNERLYLQNFFIGISKNEIGPDEEVIQKLAIPILKLKNWKKEPILSLNLKQRTGNQAAYYRNLGHDISTERAIQFVKRIVSEMLDDVLN